MIVKVEEARKEERERERQERQVVRAAREG